MSQKEEAPRAFARFVEQVCDGETHVESSAMLHKLLLALDEEAASRGKAKGRLTLTIDLSVDPKGNADCQYDVTIKEPKKMRGSGRCWLTKGSNYTFEPPKKRNGLEDVSDRGFAEEGERPARKVVDA